jgi:dihydroflavonol-4-reductase
VTGGTGFLGTHLLNVLAERGETALRILTSSGATDALRQRGWEVVEGTILSPQAVERAVTGVEEIYHLAGRVSRNPDDQRSLYEVHVEGTRLLCQAARGAGVRRVVMASSSGTVAITEDGKTIPDETYPTPLQLIARWPYYASKLYQERVARKECQEGPELVILNPSLLLGPGDRRLSSTEDVLKFLARDIPAIPPGGLNFVDVRDVAAAFAEAMKRARPGERYLLGGHNWTFEKFFDRLERLSKVKGPRLRARGKLFERGAQILDAIYRQWEKSPPVDRISVEMAHAFWYVDSSKARRELDFEPRDAGQTLYDTVAYLNQIFLRNPVFR